MFADRFYMKVKKVLILSLIMFISCFGNTAYSDDSLVSENFLKRHSGKAFDPSREISYDQLLALIQAARWACSSFNDQPWNFIICERSITPEAYQKALSSIIPSQQKWAMNAPMLVVIIARTNFLYNGKFNEWAEYDTGAAAISMALQACDLDLMTHQIGGFDKSKIIQDFELEENFKPLSIMAIGYESEGDSNPEPRTRRQIGENFFLGGTEQSVPEW